MLHDFLVQAMHDVHADGIWTGTWIWTLTHSLVSIMRFIKQNSLNCAFEKNLFMYPKQNEAYYHMVLELNIKSLDP